MKKASRIFSILFAAVLLVLALGVSNAQDTVTIEWWHIQTIEEQGAYWDQVVADFQVEYPYVEVEQTVLENDAFKTQLVNVMQAGDPPDLFQSWGGGILWSFANAGLLRDIAPEMDANDGEWRNSFAAQGALNLYGQGEEMYGAPWNFSAVGIFYNKDIFAEAGIENTPETWEEFLEVVDTLKEFGVAPITVGEQEKWPGMFWFAYLALRTGGVEAYADAYTRDGSFTDEPFVEAFTMLQDLVERDAFIEGFLGLTYNDSAGVLARGEAAMELMGAWHPNVVRDADEDGEIDFDLGWFPFPAVEGGAGAPNDAFGGGDGFAVGSNAPDEAVELLKYITSYEVQLGAAEIWVTPVVVGTELDPEEDGLPAVIQNYLLEAPGFMAFLDQFYPPALGLTVNDAVETVFAGTASPEDAAAIIEDEAAFELE